MKIILIAAVGRNRELGKNNSLIWKLPDDLYRFSVLTRDHIVVMGRKTLESIPGPLARREMIVLTRQPIEGFYTEQNKNSPVKAFGSIDDVLTYCNSKNADKLFVIGGAEIYKQFLPLAHELDLTLIDDEEPKADAFFPEYEQDFIQEFAQGMRDERIKVDYKFTRWSRKI